MTKIINGAELNGIYGSTVFTDAELCPTYQQILQTNKFNVSTISGKTYANEQLVLKTSVTKYVVSDDYHYYGVTMWYFQNETNSVNPSALSWQTIVDMYGSQSQCLRAVIESYDPETPGSLKYELDYSIIPTTSPEMSLPGGSDIINPGGPILCDCVYMKDNGVVNYSNRENLGYVKADEDYNNDLDNCYIIPYEGDSDAHKLFFDCEDGGGLYSIGVSKLIGSVYQPYFVSYNTQIYYSAPYEENGTTYVNKFKLRYFNNGNPLFPVGEYNHLSNKEYGVIGSIVGDSSLNSSREYAIAYAYNAVDANIQYSNANSGSLYWDGQMYYQCDSAKSYSEKQETIDGKTYMVKDYSNSYTPIPYSTGSGSGSNTGSTGATVEYLNLVNLAPHKDIQVYKLNTTNDANAQLQYIGYVGCNEGSLFVGLTQNDVENPHATYFAFACGNTQDASGSPDGSVVLLSSGFNYSDYDSDKGYYVCSYDSNLSTPLVPLLDKSKYPYTLQFISLNDLMSCKNEAQNWNGYVGLHNYTHEMQDYIEIANMADSSSSVVATLWYDGSEENDISLGVYDSGDLTIDMNKSYYNYYVSFDSDVELYARVNYDGDEYEYRYLMSLSADEQIEVDKIRMTQVMGSVFIESYLYVKVL